MRERHGPPAGAAQPDVDVWGRAASAGGGAPSTVAAGVTEESPTRGVVADDALGAEIPTGPERRADSLRRGVPRDRGVVRDVHAGAADEFARAGAVRVVVLGAPARAAAVEGGRAGLGPALADASRADRPLGAGDAVVTSRSFVGGDGHAVSAARIAHPHQAVGVQHGAILGCSRDAHPIEARIPDAAGGRRLAGGSVCHGYLPAGPVPRITDSHRAPGGVGHAVHLRAPANAEGAGVAHGAEISIVAGRTFVCWDGDALPGVSVAGARHACAVQTGAIPRRAATTDAAGARISLRARRSVLTSGAVVARRRPAAPVASIE
jgi:hypothetical protein